MATVLARGNGDEDEIDEDGDEIVLALQASFGTSAAGMGFWFSWLVSLDASSFSAGCCCCW